MNPYQITSRRSTLGFAFALATGLLVACSTASDQQEKVRAAEVEANEKINVAAAEADRKIASAEASFMQMREDYRHTTTTNLVELDRDTERLATGARLLVGDARVERDARIGRIAAAREAFVTDYKSLDATSGATWDETKSRLDTRWLALRALVDQD